MKPFRFTTLILLLSAPIFAAHHWEALVSAGDLWRYFVGTSEPPAQWISLDFKDAAWQTGRGGFGYGDNDDVTVVPATLSIYLRRSFEVKDLSKIERLLFIIDYDDAFVAYLNGVEIARSAGLADPRPPYNRPSTVGREAVLYQGGTPESWPVDLGLLRQGMNVLAVQVHNQDISSSDLSAIPYLLAGITETTRRYQPTPSWFVEPFDFESSNLPILIIDTQGQEIPDEPKIMARMKIIDNGPGARNRLTDPPNGYDGWIGIESRGNASQMFEKKPYSFETRNEDGSDNDVKLLGMPKEKDWILISAFIDRTLMRDAVAYYLSRSLGRWAPRTRHVEVFLNGDYRGVYILVEKIKWGKNRLNITKLDTMDISGDAVTGGYIWAVQQADPTDVVFGNNGNQRVLKYPKANKVRPQQLAYIRQADDFVKALVDKPYFSDPTRGYHQYIDVSSFIDELLVQEATKNSDAYGWSGFFHKDRLGKICAGPVWDFDQALSNSTYNEGDIVDRWVVEDWDPSMPRIWLKLWNDPAFREDVANRWFSLRSGPWRTDRIFAFVDSVAAYLNEAQQRNFKRWPILGQFLWRETAGYEKRNTYQKEVDYMKNFIRDHTAWMDEQLQGYVRVEQKESLSPPQVVLSPNPFSDRLELSVTLPREAYVAVEIYNALGQRVRRVWEGTAPRGTARFTWDGADEGGHRTSPGVYFCLVKGGELSQRFKLIKF
ncbi:MAG: CotH kinase family protein [candidate division KSB1 bacterium]|nr:CotH kinase family protein [candidate division KSB1 bacterium]